MPSDWVPEHWLIIWKRWFRWHWELRNLAAVPWASGTARTFAQAQAAGSFRAKVGPLGPLPTRPDPGIPEVRPRMNYLPIKGGESAEWAAECREFGCHDASE